VLVRWSESEFLALLPATDRAGAARTAERLKAAADGMAAAVEAAHWVGDTAQDLLGRVGAR
jgi:GGDEF domain-containing protein